MSMSSRICFTSGDQKLSSSANQPSQTPRGSDTKQPGAAKISKPKDRKHNQPNQLRSVEGQHQLDPEGTRRSDQSAHPQPGDTGNRSDHPANACLQCATQQCKLHPPSQSSR